ncbi:DNA polymerase III subunit beta [Cohnella sp. GbtcB17]|uniref:DNA polymerase III subunit beta n=1 Tax=Cohnella sp. GbtcB17 TaxID=2824762 RepID=UPI001C305A48|nr:DNA polymerase III subunit beta [Cohnella sp. GbtcB17]
MHLTIDKQHLHDALERVSSAVNNTHNNEIYRGIHCTAADDGIRLVGTDGIYTVEETIPPDLFALGAPGQLVFPSALTSNIVKRLPDGLVEIGDDRLTATFKSGRANLSVECMDPDQFTLERMPDVPAIKMTAGALGEMIRSTTFCASTKDKEPRPILHGVLIKTDGESLAMFAGDGGRAAAATETTASDVGLNSIIHHKHLSSARKLFKSGDAVRILNQNKRFYILGERIKVSIVQMRGNFPPVESVFAGSDLYTASIMRTDFLEAVERVRLPAEDDVIEFSFKANRIEMRGESQLGKAHETVEPFKFKGDAVELAFNGKFVSEAVKAITGDWLNIRITTTQGRPIILSDESSSKATYFIGSRRVRGAAYGTN